MMYGWDMGLGWLMMLLLWIVPIAAVLWLVSERARPAGRGRAREILEERFARGEIDAEELKARRAALEH